MFRWCALLSIACAPFACSYDFDAFHQVPSDAAPADDAAATDQTAPPTDDGAVSVDGATTDVVDIDVVAPGDSAPDAPPDVAPDVVIPCNSPGAVEALGHCYFPISQNQTWDNANAACIAASAHLVVIGSAAEQQVVQNVGNNRERWLGFRRATGQPANNASYAAVNGEARTYENWDQGEPNGSGECARMKGQDDDWADGDCGAMAWPVCERP